MFSKLNKLSITNPRVSIENARLASNFIFQYETIYVILLTINALLSLLLLLLLLLSSLCVKGKKAKACDTLSLQKGQFKTQVSTI